MKLETLNERSAKEQLFGVIHKTRTGVLALNPEVLKEKFESPDAVMYAVCVNKDCSGLVYELTETGARFLFNVLKQPFVVRPGEYLELGSCGRCAGGDYTVKLKKMS
jgi:hypothetical protein